jgi:hypothetical protein
LPFLFDDEWESWAKASEKEKRRERKNRRKQRNNGAHKKESLGIVKIFQSSKYFHNGKRERKRDHE